MKSWEIIFCVTSLIAGLIGGLFIGIDIPKAEMAVQNKQLAELALANNALLDSNIRLEKISNLKSFVNKKELDRFLDSAKTYANFSSEDYASKACINLMRESKEAGYWMGLTAINSSTDSYFAAMVKERQGDSSIKWRVWNVVVVGDSDIYLVDAKDRSGVYFVVSFTGDFAEYTKEIEVKTLPYDRIAK